MAAFCQSRQHAVETLFQQYPKIPHALPHSPDYTALRATFMVDNPAMPIAIARPQNAEDVSVIVLFCVSHSVPFVVRSGGNNLFGKSQVHEALTIDLRDINYCHVDHGQSSARIGGGILAGTLVDALSKAGVMTASGMVHFIGYFGWAAYGGYGPFSGNLGYGFEQILGAKVVNWKGEILDADEELLKGIRGAGGSFGIVVEITIAVRPLTKVRLSRSPVLVQKTLRISRFLPDSYFTMPKTLQLPSRATAEVFKTFVLRGGRPNCVSPRCSCVLRRGCSCSRTSCGVTKTKVPAWSGLKGSASWVNSRTILCGRQQSLMAWAISTHLSLGMVADLSTPSISVR